MRALPGWCVVSVEEKTKEGELFLPETAKTEIQQGEVIEVGGEYWRDGRYHEPPVKKGDRIIFTKYHDQAVDINGKKYKVLPVEKVMLIL